MKLVGERRALASVILIFYAGLYLLVVASGQLPEGFGKAFAAVGAVYGLAFFALVAGYFWARWFAMGVALSGVISGVVSMWQMGPEEVLLFFTGSHLAVVLFLWGEAMAAPFDGQTAWRERFHIDENARHRLGKAVIRAGVSLPYVILYALAPKPGSSVIETVMAIAVASLAFGGIWGLIKLRTWGVAAMALAAGVCAVSAIEPHAISAVGGIDVSAAAAVAAIALGGAVLPFLRPVARFVGAR